MKLNYMTPQTGHTTLEIDTNVEAEVKEGIKKFEELLGQGYTAYSITHKGGKKDGEQIRKFDPAAEEIMMIPAMQGGC